MATIGKSLSQPETGWKRISCRNSAYLYDGFNLTNLTSSYAYDNGYVMDNANSSSDSNIKFNFSGSKIRLILFTNYDKSSNNIIRINDINYTFSAYTSNVIGMNLVFEKLDCRSNQNYVTIIPGGKFVFDSIDIDLSSSIQPYKVINNYYLIQDGNDLEISYNNGLLKTDSLPYTEDKFKTVDFIDLSLINNNVISKINNQKFNVGMIK